MKRLYNQLMKICDKDDNMFFYVDHVTKMQTTVRVFSYHVANCSDWLQKGALECRGIMFEMADGKPVRIMSRPMEKFFNLGEFNVDINTLCEILINQGRLSKSVYERAKGRNKEISSNEVSEKD